MRTIQITVDGRHHSMRIAQISEHGIASYPQPMALVGGHWLPLHGLEQTWPTVRLSAQQAALVGL